jgi:hypothetical protein
MRTLRLGPYSTHFHRRNGVRAAITVVRHNGRPVPPDTQAVEQKRRFGRLLLIRSSRVGEKGWIADAIWYRPR